MPQLQKLPIGIQTFSEVREDNFIYIDKTDQIKRMVEEGKYYFLSRPRRFGKSMLISTLQSLFEGRKELFEELYIYDKWDWDTTNPVIRLSFDGVARDLADMKQDVKNILLENQDYLGITCPDSDDIGGCFKYLIRSAYEKYGQKVVILVDEYDKLIVDNLDQPEVARQGREVLRDLYTTIKGSDQYIHFAFLTGVSKFSKVSVFSGLNNLEDITLNPDFATICGYTQHDLETTFAARLSGVDMDKVRYWYNGYNFLGEKVYNPFDILLFIKNKCVFDNYWFATGTPTFLIKLIEQNSYHIPQLENLKVSKGLIDSYNIENIALEPILFQSGYLSIKEAEFTDFGAEYVLGFPNHEVRISFHDVVARALTNKSDILMEKKSLLKSLKEADIEQFRSTLNRVFSSIPYNNYTKNQISIFEGYYASIAYVYLASLGLELKVEDPTSTGRIDMTIQIGDIVYILEFKVEGKGDALAQIKEKEYHLKFMDQGKEIYLIGIHFDSVKRNISSFEWEKV